MGNSKLPFYSSTLDLALSPAAPGHAGEPQDDLPSGGAADGPGVPAETRDIKS